MTSPILHNWAGNLAYTASIVQQPETVEGLQQLVRKASKARAVGTKHSFNSIADSPGELISTSRLNRVLSLNGELGTVTIEGGITYGRLAEELHRQGFALHNLASLPHISVAGACATATHGSGNANGNLATAVRGMDIVIADGSIVEFCGEELSGAVVNLGCLGVVARMTLAIEPTFDVRQHVYERLPLDSINQEFDAITSSAFSVSLFYDWQTDKINQVWLKHRASFDAPPTFYGATLAPAKRHPLEGNSAENCTEQMGIPGPWYERLPHFRMDFTPSNGEELQSEYFVPRRHAVAAIHSIREISEMLAPILYVSEIRTVAADKLWLSPCYEQDSVGIHFTWRQNWLEVSKVLPVIESLLEPFDVRPHWGKLFTTAAGRVKAKYERLPDFQRLAGKFDPEGKFRNTFTSPYLT